MLSSPGIGYAYCMSVGRGVVSERTKNIFFTPRLSVRVMWNAFESSDQTSAGRDGRAAAAA